MSRYFQCKLNAISQTFYGTGSSYAIARKRAIESMKNAIEYPRDPSRFEVEELRRRIDAKNPEFKHVGFYIYSDRRYRK